jgi:Zn-dependent peptidase ImmA (M78 family)
MIKRFPQKIVRDLLYEYNINSLEELDLNDIADGESLIIEEADLGNYLGKIVFSEDCGIITINSKIKDIGQFRFTVAHEFGHYFLERGVNKNNKFSCTSEDVNYYKSSKISEMNANIFAAELLMPLPWFESFTSKRDVNKNLIFDISKNFKVSLTASAIRYAEIGKFPLAVIMCCESGVLWNCINSNFPLKYIPVGYRLRKQSGAFDFFQNNIQKADAQLVLAKTWFEEDLQCRSELYFYEQNIYFTNYNNVLTLLWECKI